jgi:two-component system alkaline phosphatase synthesis response regulator PhoP/two-component system response regulator RpaA
MEPAEILVIEDDYIVARTIERSLRSDEFHVTLASRGEKGIFIARQSPPDLVILDIIMPDMDGYQVCQTMRADPQLSQVPILFLTAKVRPQDKIAGFKVGADDYLSKPFNVDELILRVKAILRRTRTDQEASPEQDAVATPGKTPYQLSLQGYILDTRTFELQIPGRGTIRLTPLQYDLLYHLMTHPGETFSPNRLLDEVWDFPSGKGSPDLVRVHIKTLRERIESDPTTPSFIRTVPGRGYMVGDPPPAENKTEA